MVEKKQKVEAEEKEAEMRRREKNYHMQHCMGMWEEKEAEEDKGRDGWTMLENILKRDT